MLSAPSRHLNELVYFRLCERLPFRLPLLQRFTLPQLFLIHHSQRSAVGQDSITVMVTSFRSRSSNMSCIP